MKQGPLTQPSIQVIEDVEVMLTSTRNEWSFKKQIVGWVKEQVCIGDNHYGMAGKIFCKYADVKGEWQIEDKAFARPYWAYGAWKTTRDDSRRYWESWAVENKKAEASRTYD